MLMGIYRSAALLAVIVVYYTMDSWLIHRFDKLRRQGSGRSWSYTLAAWAAGAVLLAQPIWLPQLGLTTSAWWGAAVQVVGAVVIGAALLLHWWSRFTLGQFYGERAEVQPGHVLVFGGPYSYVRHPIFTSFFALAIGLLLLAPALTTLLVVIYVFVDFLGATEREEKLLAERLPGYRDYMRKVGRFLPKFG